jgi:uncharacterized membrane protein YhiD involved in acid resistance
VNHRKGFTNLTTLASIGFAESIDMAIGFEFCFIAIVEIAFVVLVSKSPGMSKLKCQDR